MKRREAIKIMGLTGGAMIMLPFELTQEKLNNDKFDKKKVVEILEKLKEEPPANTEIRNERGGTRMFLNGEEVYPLLALSVGMLDTADEFSAAGINFFAPILGMRSAWLGKDQYDL